jgi:hypothetical protein
MEDEWGPFAALANGLSTVFVLYYAISQIVKLKLSKKESTLL